MPRRPSPSPSPSQRPSGGRRRSCHRHGGTAGRLGVLLVALVAGLLGACGGGLRALPWRAELARSFDGAWPGPYAPPPRAAWSRADETLFLQRIGFAEVVAVGRFRLVSLVTRRTQPLRLVLDFEAEEVLLGGLEGGAQLDRPLRLTLSASATGFAALARGVADPLAGRYLLLVRNGPSRSRTAPPLAGWEASLWRPEPAAAPRRRFAVYRIEPALLAQVRGLYRSLLRRGQQSP